ncbi:hypothetical protein COL55_13400 [Bacillus toyonensis]|jgi:hypothetical protein|uniref:hypothetical protein n=1 Tax=Bacillus toyonensis TaxID=155322 RepID=UPI000BEFEB38|nr:hypothetical protein [Bacillus toyonensis]PEL23420.1 hypothetical protein CN624_21205 [Bacillus toyonensis]PFY49098.1 hypothetical protein COL55_13400 [Bacillus toyonensis]PHD51846.1 hypothetical protein COF75_07390 [Bacillus toyonensis]
MKELEVSNRGSELDVDFKFDKDDELQIEIYDHNDNHTIYYATRDQVEKLYIHLKGVLDL